MIPGYVKDSLNNVKYRCFGHPPTVRYHYQSPLPGCDNGISAAFLEGLHCHDVQHDALILCCFDLTSVTALK